MVVGQHERAAREHEGDDVRAEAPPPAPPSAAAGIKTRITSIDAFRGFVMFLMLAEAMRLWTLHDGLSRAAGSGRSSPSTPTHVPWQGCSLHDLIQPAFSFLVGAALPFSIASRTRARRDASRRMLAHAVVAQRRADPARHLPALAGQRSRPTGRSRTRSRRSASATRSCSCWRSRRCACRSIAFVAILVGFWAAFVALSAAAGRTSTTRASACRRTGRTSTRASSRTSTRTRTSSWAFDVWFLNLFPRESPFLFNERRLVDAQLHPDAGDDDARPVGRASG